MSTKCKEIDTIHNIYVHACNNSEPKENRYGTKVAEPEIKLKHIGPSGAVQTVSDSRRPLF